MEGKNRSRRGTGHLYQKDDRWYGQWYVRGKRVKRSLGPVRQPGAGEGLTKRQAQARMLEAMAETDSAPAVVRERLTVEEVGKRRIRELARRGRKQDTTLANYESEIRCHFLPHFARSPIAEIGEDDVADFIDASLNDLSVKTVRNLYVHLNAIFEFAIQAVVPRQSVQAGGQARFGRGRRYGDPLPRPGGARCPARGGGTAAAQQAHARTGGQSASAS